MLARLSAFVIWAFVAGAAMFWGLRLWVQPSVAPANLTAVSASGGVQGDISRLLGAEEAPAAAVVAPESSRFKLLGLMAGKSVGNERTPGVALIAVDGKPPRTYGAGARVDGELFLQTLGLRTAALGPSEGPASFVLEVPPLAAAATGTLGAPTDMSSAGGASPDRAEAPPQSAEPNQRPVPPSMRGRPGGPMDSMMR